MSNLGVWEAFRDTIKNHLANDNINNFHNWHVLQSTMIAGVDEIEYQTLNESPYWSIWGQHLSESILKPNSYYNFPSSSTNNMHHAYSLDVMMRHLNIPLNEFGTIIEFGGGYGNTCRLIKRWGHNKDFYIYDIPELIIIQKHYLSSNGINDVQFKAELDTIPIPEGKSLFLALWSISEVPVPERAGMLQRLKFFECENIFIAMGGSFYSENNIEWLETSVYPRLKELGYTFDLHRIAHGQDMFYFVAKR